MTEAIGNLWELPADWRVITTNGFVKANGECVMGRGCAREARDRFPGIAKRIGEAIRTNGNRLYVFSDLHLITFPTKHVWWEASDPVLITLSAEQLAAFAATQPDRRFVMPRPGCGNGQLNWEDVRPLIAPILPDNVTVVTFGERS